MVPLTGDVPSCASDDGSVSASVPNKTVWAGNRLGSLCPEQNRVASYFGTLFLTLVLLGGTGWGVFVIVACGLLSIWIVFGFVSSPNWVVFLFRILDRDFLSGLWDASYSLSSLCRRSTWLAIGVFIGSQGEPSYFQCLAFIASIFVATSPLSTLGIVFLRAAVGVLARFVNVQLIRLDVSVFLFLNSLPLEKYTDRLLSCTIAHGLHLVIRNVRDDSISVRIFFRVVVGPPGLDTLLIIIHLISLVSYRDHIIHTLTIIHLIVCLSYILENHYGVALS